MRRATSLPRSLFRRLVKPKKEPKAEPEQEEEWPGQKEAEEASFNTVQSALPEWVEDWSLRAFAEEELERQRVTLAELESRSAEEKERQGVANAAYHSRILPPPTAKEIAYSLQA